MVLPAPFEPIKPQNCPGSMEKTPRRGPGDRPGHPDVFDPQDLWQQWRSPTGGLPAAAACPGRRSGHRCSVEVPLVMACSMALTSAIIHDW